MGKMKYKNLIMFFLFITFLYSCDDKSGIQYKFLDDNKPYCVKAYWEAITYNTDESNNTKITNSKIWYKNNNYRIEIYNEDMTEKQIIIIKDGKFYLFINDKKIYVYNVNDENVEIFLRKIFVNTGFGKKKKKFLIKNVIYNQKKCDVYEHKMYRNINGFLCEAIVKEWFDKKNMIVRAESYIYRTEFKFNKNKIYIGPLKEVYEIKNFKCYFILSSKLFELPDNYEVIDFNSYYKQQLLKSGKTSEATDAGIVTFNVKK